MPPLLRLHTNADRQWIRARKQTAVNCPARPSSQAPPTALPYPRRHAHEPAEHGGHAPTPPLLRQTHILIPPKVGACLASMPLEPGAADLPSAWTRQSRSQTTSSGPYWCARPDVGEPLQRTALSLWHRTLSGHPTRRGYSIMPEI